jgi:hypothetical protein
MYLTAYSPVADFFEYGHEPSVCKGLTNFLDHLRKYLQERLCTMEQGTSQPKELSCMTPGGYERNKWRIQCFRKHLQTYTSALIFEYKDSKKTGINALINGVMRFDDPSPRISALHYSPANRNGKVTCLRGALPAALLCEWNLLKTLLAALSTHILRLQVSLGGRAHNSATLFRPRYDLLRHAQVGQESLNPGSTAGFRRNTFHCFYYHYSAFLKSRHKHATGQQSAK